MQSDLHGVIGPSALSLASLGSVLRVGILGFGVDGRCVAEFLCAQPGVDTIVVFDDDVTRHSSLVTCRATLHRATSDALDGVRLLFRSPGFKLTHPLVVEAMKRGIPITSSTTYFLQHFPGTTIGVTGSNGKTTCAALIAEMLRAEFGKECVEEGGNDRKPRLDLLVTKNQKPKTKNPQYVVLELSSFQLSDCPVSPDVAVVLNISPNHLDWHTDMAEYIEAKRRIVRFQVSGSKAVLNPDDPTVRSFAEGIQSDVRWFEDPPPCTVRCRTHPDTIRAAVTTARALHVSEEHIAYVLETFPGIPQRLEFVRELDGVAYYNDSSCTTPESAITACEAFPESTVVLLLGGRDKGMDFSKLYAVIRERYVRVVPYGEMAQEFCRTIPAELQFPISNFHLPKNSQFPIPNSQFLQVVETAREHANPGDNVILSPACASFDMFENAKERGRMFEKIVRSL